MMPLLFYIIKRHVCIKYFIFYAIWQKWKARISLRCRDIHQSSLIKAVNPWKTKKEKKWQYFDQSAQIPCNWFQFSWLIFFIVIRKPGIRGAWGGYPVPFLFARIDDKRWLPSWQMGAFWPVLSANAQTNLWSMHLEGSKYALKGVHSLFMSSI